MGMLSSFSFHISDYSLAGLSSTVTLSFVAITVLKALYNIYLHPLSKYPGPCLAAASRLWYCYHCYRGSLVHTLHELHEKYGDAVRTAPDELSFTSQSAWNDIYGHRLGKAELMKDPTFYQSISSGPGSIINADRSRHGPLRKQASYGFSERALRSQEPVIKKYADLMIQRLEECVETGKPTVDIVDWYNFFTFDIMGDMVFGESFNCLTNWGYHPWVKLIFDSVKAGAFFRCVKYFPLLRPFYKWLVPQDIRKRRTDQRAMAAEKAAYRKALDDKRQDLISGFLLPDSGVTAQEYQSTSETLIIAGSETTATLMSGFTYYILQDPDRLEKLTAEIRNAFSSAEEISIVSVNKLTYLLACLDEALRIYPPVPETFPRNTGPRAEVISGSIVLPHDADQFIPERWLEGNNGYESDRKDVVHPFHVGPRNCLGRNLAYFEMRILLARLFWQFDLELDPRSAKWNQQKAYLLWEKPSMFVRLMKRAI